MSNTTFNNLPLEESLKFAKQEFSNQHEAWQFTERGSKICMDVSMQLTKANAKLLKWQANQIE